MPGIQPTVDTPMLEWAIPTSGNRSQAASTLSRFMSGSPMPMKTARFTGSLRRKCRAWSRISEAVRLRPKRIVPVAQNVQVRGQPDCEETQTDRRPSRNRISTASTGRPSRVCSSALTVPSPERASRLSSSDENGTRSASSSVESGTDPANRSRRPAGRLVISA